MLLGYAKLCGINFINLYINAATIKNNFDNQVNYKLKIMSQVDQKRLSICGVLSRTFFKVKESFNERSARSKIFSFLRKIFHQDSFSHFCFQVKMPREQNYFLKNLPRCDLKIGDGQTKCSKNLYY